MQDWTINLISEDSLLVEWSVDIKQDRASKKLIAKIARLSHYLLSEYSAIIINVTPAYRTCLIQFDVCDTDADSVIQLIEAAISEDLQASNKQAELHQFPVFYDPTVATDLTCVCENKQITIDQLIELHTSVIYDVYAVGFLPGFAYLGYLPAQLNSARHSSFRANVPAGSVGIADRQTAIYPSESPGGWQIIGRSPKALINQQASVLKAGDMVQFTAIDRAEYLALGGRL